MGKKDAGGEEKSGSQTEATLFRQMRKKKSWLEKDSTLWRGVLPA